MKAILNMLLKLNNPKSMITEHIDHNNSFAVLSFVEDRTSKAPVREVPIYPAGVVNRIIPPLCVTLPLPSRLSFISTILPPVMRAIIACQVSCIAVVYNLSGVKSRCRFKGMILLSQKSNAMRNDIIVKFIICFLEIFFVCMRLQ